ncbi:DUF6612 family protein [Azotosporobacter soli]|uniref:DUF6612 family protein n=1 Tax=Azotosporobacter soli TaxID=3055040 RepID=UPI0031FEAE5F
MNRYKNVVSKMSVAALLCLLPVLFAVQTPVAAETLDDKAVVAEAYQKMRAFKSYHMTVDTVMSMHGADVEIGSNVKGEIDLMTKPMLAKTELDVVTNAETAGGNKTTSKKILQYVEETNNGIFMYTQADNQWKKQLLKSGGYDPLKEYEQYSKGIKSVEKVSEDDDRAVFSVVIKGSYMKDVLSRQLPSLGLDKINLSAEALNNISDVAYQLTLDKKSGAVSAIDMDLSSFIGEFGNSVAEAVDASPEKKQELRELFGSVSMTVHVEFSRFDAVEKFALPQELKALR